MSRLPKTALALSAALLAGCGGGPGSGDGGIGNAAPCDTVTCSGHGACTAASGVASCSCESGYHAVQLDCAPDAPLTVVGSCTVSASFLCVDYLGSSYTVSGTQGDCAGRSGTSSSTACTAAGRVGTCHLAAGTPTDALYTWYTGMFVPSAQAFCSAAGGVFMPG